jgi:hypothetical protein
MIQLMEWGSLSTKNHVSRSETAAFYPCAGEIIAQFYKRHCLVGGFNASEKY